jgi:tRNA nucleotidyltransferase/poly(A) polymerase
MNIEIPDQVRYIIEELEKSGFEAYAVGGCFRDGVMIGKTLNYLMDLVIDEKAPNDKEQLLKLARDC